VEWNPSTTGALDGTFSFSNSTSIAHIKWNATTADNTGTLIVKIYTGTGSQKVKVGESNPLSVVIKSIKHLTATFTGIPYNPTWNLSPCEQGTITLEAGTMDVPGTGTINPERVNSFEWFVPAEWTVNGVPSTGTWIKTSPNVTITYPKSGTNGTIKVRASYLTACGGDVQQSIESSAITVNRSTTLTLTPSVSFIQCGDVSPITYTITPTLPCAVYYWNNSQTPTTSNSYQFTPDGHSPINVTVTIVYGTSTPQIKTSTMNYVLFAPGVTPKIVGSAVICTSNYQYSVSDLRPGYNVLWTLDPKIQKVSESNNVVTVRSTSSGTASISATITSNCGTYSPDPTKTVWIGKPSFTSSVNGPSQLTPGLSAVYSITPTASQSSYSWQIPSGCYSTYCWHITSGQGTTAIAVQAGAIGSGAIQVTASNACPGNDSRYMYVTVQDPSDPCDNLALSITPNPSLGGDVVIDVIQPPCDPTLMSSTPATLSVIDNMGTVVYSKKHTGKKIEIKGLRLTKGLYHVVYIKDNRKFEKSMIVD